MTFLFLALSLALGTTAATADVTCPHPFIPLGSQCYFFSEKKESWAAARETCKAMVTGDQTADLAVFDTDPGDYTLVFKHATLLGKDWWWIGGTDESIEDYWMWVNGRPINMLKSYWQPQQPESAKDKNALAIEYATEKYPRRRLLALDGRKEVRYICQLNVKSVA